MNYTLGIDVSHHQGSWKSSHLRSDVKFLIHKTTEGGSAYDRAYDRNRMACPSDVKWGAYHLLRETASIEQQIENFITRAALLPGDIAALDVETKWAKALVDIYGTVVTRAKINLWMLEVSKRLRCTPLLYISERGLKALTRGWREPLGLLKSWPLWLCQYVKFANWRPQRIDRGPSLPQGFDDWTLWQFTSGASGKDNGFESTHLDLDLLNGDISKLNQLAVRPRFSIL